MTNDDERKYSSASPILAGLSYSTEVSYEDVIGLVLRGSGRQFVAKTEEYVVPKRYDVGAFWGTYAGERVVNTLFLESASISSQWYSRCEDNIGIVGFTSWHHVELFENVSGQDNFSDDFLLKSEPSVPSTTESAREFAIMMDRFNLECSTVEDDGSLDDLFDDLNESYGFERHLK
jgi:hypothetical protein